MVIDELQPWWILIKKCKLQAVFFIKNQNFYAIQLFAYVPYIQIIH
jgi:hypothetical protein